MTPQQTHAPAPTSQTATMPRKKTILAIIDPNSNAATNTEYIKNVEKEFEEKSKEAETMKPSAAASDAGSSTVNDTSHQQHLLDEADGVLLLLLFVLMSFALASRPHSGDSHQPPPTRNDPIPPRMHTQSMSSDISLPHHQQHMPVMVC
jgi:hypothetical protein